MLDWVGQIMKWMRYIMWLIIDETGLIIAILATDDSHAQQVAQAMSAHAELTLNVNWHLGEHLPIWHD